MAIHRLCYLANRLAPQLRSTSLKRVCLFYTLEAYHITKQLWTVELFDITDLYRTPNVISIIPPHRWHQLYDNPVFPFEYHLPDLTFDQPCLLDWPILYTVDGIRQDIDLAYLTYCTLS